MPLYEYECQECGRRIEKIQKFSDPPLTTCEACGGVLERLVSSPAIQFKGTGWYVTDYAKPTSASGSTDSPSNTSGDGDKKPKKTEKVTKPAKSTAEKG